MSIWEGPVTSWTAKALAIDDKGLFHGVCQFSADDNRTGRHDFLGWKLKMFVGKFVHGKPEGYFVLQTWKNNVITATFREGVLHGPAYALGRSSILDIEVIIYCFYCIRRKTREITDYRNEASYLVWVTEFTWQRISWDSFEMDKFRERSGSECLAGDIYMELPILR